ncbi:GAP family protein [Microbacterium sp. ZW T5_45]|uniref:GAP family protein n=1 Tax=Microbacterium sp. ZW T5_45 TaxID=3378080 RepID=UPI0038520624
MELFGGLPLPLSLAVLALLDGLSVGTLLIPVFLLLSPGKVRGGRVLLYLATIATFYLVIGLLFLWGLVNVVDVAADFLASPVGLVVRLVVGAALLITAFVIPGGGSTKDTVVPAPAGGVRRPIPEGVTLSPPSAVAGAGAGAGERDGAGVVTGADAAPGVGAASVARPGRITRWRARLLDPKTRGTAVMAVAIAAGLVEVATMLPYIVAMTMLADAGVGAPIRVAALAGYCLLMIVPAMVLLVLRIVAARAVERPLARFAAWMERTGAENTAWIIGILGFLIARSAATELGLFEALGTMVG